MNTNHDLDAELISLLAGEIPSIEHRLDLTTLMERVIAKYPATMVLYTGIVAHVWVFDLGRELVVHTGDDPGGRNAHSLNLPLKTWLASGAVMSIQIFVDEKESDHGQG